MNKVYLDNNSTTKIDDRVLDSMLPYFKDKFGNPSSSSHALGWEAQAAIDQARKEISEIINANQDEIIFTSGATESNNLAIKGYLNSNCKTNSNIIMTPEHHQIFDKDYIIISEESGETHLLNRKGQTRSELTEKIHRSNNKLNLIEGTTLQNTKLITTNENGQVIYIYLDGNIDTLDIQNLKNGDRYIKNKNHIIILKGNSLMVSSNLNQFQYNFKTDALSAPKLFYKNDSVIIAIRQETENLIYLFNEKGELYTQPFFGTTDFSIGKLNNKKEMNLIVGSNEGLIYNYKIN